MTTWKIDSILVKPQEAGYTDVVYQVFWTVSDTDGVNTAGRAGGTELSPPDGDFTPYENLTEQQMLGWVQAVIGESEVNAIATNLNLQLVYMADPPVTALPLPWAG